MIIDDYYLVIILISLNRRLSNRLIRKHKIQTDDCTFETPILILVILKLQMNDNWSKFAKLDYSLEIIDDHDSWIT